MYEREQRNEEVWEIQGIWEKNQELWERTELWWGGDQNNGRQGIKRKTRIVIEERIGETRDYGEEQNCREKMGILERMKNCGREREFEERQNCEGE